MKRIVTIVLAFLYLAITSGLVVELHYCMGRLVESEWSITHSSDDHACGKCGMAKAADSQCCHNEVAVFKVSDSHQLSSYQVDVPAIDLSIPGAVVAYEPLVVEPFSDFPSFSSSPPGKERRSIQDFYCIYRI